MFKILWLDARDPKRFWNIAEANLANLLHSVRNPATLILCPPHLVGQWEDEFFKFLGDQVQLVHPCTVPAKAKKRVAA